MNSFMSYLKSNYPSYHKELSKYSVGSSSFDAAWKRLAQDGGFGSAQHNFIKKSHYDPVASRAKSELGIDVNGRSSALQNVIWSLGVQHGSGGAMNVMKGAGVKNSMSDEAIIRAIYAERSKVDKYFSRSSSAIKTSVKNRFVSELNDALKMLKG